MTEGVSEVLANGRVEMLHTEPWSGMPDELIEAIFKPLEKDACLKFIYDFESGSGTKLEPLAARP